MADDEEAASQHQGDRKQRDPERASRPSPASPLKRHTSQVQTAVDASAKRQDACGKTCRGRFDRPDRPRRRASASCALSPPMIGPMVRSRDQTAATAIAPAPMKRTSLRQMPLTKLARSPCIGVIAVMMGTAPAQAIRMPSQHGETDGNAHQMAGAHQRQGKREAVAACSDRAGPEEAFRAVDRQPHGDGDGQARRRERAIDHRQQAFARFGICRRARRRRPCSTSAPPRLRDKEGRIA